jgi:hypothetical protein
MNNFVLFSAIGSVVFGEQKEIFEISINVLMFGPSYVPTRLQFDLSVLVRKNRLQFEIH